MCIQYYSYRIEFQDRGAGHVHGVLWCDWKAFCSNVNNQKEFGDKLEFVEKAFKTLKDDSKILSSNEIEALLLFVDTFTTCSLDPEVIEGKMYRLTDNDNEGNSIEGLQKMVKSAAKKVTNIVCDCNRHHHTKSCRKYHTTCRFNVPHFPTKETIIAIPISKISEYADIDDDFSKFKNIDKEKIRPLATNYQKILDKVQKI